MVGLSAGLDFLRQLFGVLISFSTSVYCSNTTIYFSSSDNVWSIRSRHLSLPSSCIVSANPGLDGAQVVATRIRLNSTAGFWVVCFSRALRVSFNWLSETLNALLKQTTQKPAVLFSLIRVATTWAPSSPGLADTMQLLGKDKC